MRSKSQIYQDLARARAELNEAEVGIDDTLKAMETWQYMRDGAKAKINKANRELVGLK